MAPIDDHSADDHSVTRWIGSLKEGDGDAARRLWDRYFQRMVSLARKRLRSSYGAGADRDEEDAALSAFDSLCAGAARGRFPQLSDRDDLWRLLVVVTSRKAQDQAQHARRQKRGGGRVIGEAALAGGDGDRQALDQIMGCEPNPEFAAQVAEESRRLLDALGDDELRQIALWKMEGYTGEEIAERLGRSLRTVANKLALIRMKWEREVE